MVCQSLMCNSLTSPLNSDCKAGEDLWELHSGSILYCMSFKLLLLNLNWQFLSSPCRPVPQRLLQLREWGSGRQPCCVAVHPSPIYLTYGGDAGSPSLLSARVKTPLQAGKPKPHPSLGPDRNQEEELQTCAHETQHQVQLTLVSVTVQTESTKRNQFLSCPI